MKTNVNVQSLSAAYLLLKISTDNKNFNDSMSLKLFCTRNILLISKQMVDMSLVFVSIYYCETHITLSNT